MATKKSYDAAYYAAHREERKAGSAAYEAAHREERAAYNAAYRATHREEIAAYKEVHRERLRARDAIYYAAHLEESRARDAVYRAANLERVRASRTAWAKANLATGAAYARNRRVRKLGAEGVATVADIAARWTYFGDKCWMCGGIATATDHVKPLAKGGSNWPANLRPACGPCNSGKRDKWPLAVAA